MANTIGKSYKVTIFGQSHAEAMGCVIDGLPAGTQIDFNHIETQLKRRKPKDKVYSTTRNEIDSVEFVSGIVDGKTCEAPICAIIKNTNQKSIDYDELRNHPRPGHADYPAFVKYNGYNDIAGGGQFSGRLTAPLTVAGAIAESILNEKGIYIVARIKQIYDVVDSDIDMAKVTYNNLKKLKVIDFPTINKKAAKEMQKLITNIKNEGDSLGGIVECLVFGLPIGLGNPLFESIESEISKMVFSIPGVRGIEFGCGFESVKLKGSEHNDSYTIIDGSIKTRTNNHGGALGGITTGMPLIYRVAFKPTSSIAKEQETILINDKTTYTLAVKGRHDACFVPRALVALEMATAITVLDLYMQEGLL